MNGDLCHVLLVEDNAEDVRLVCAALTARTESVYTVDHVDSLAQALERIAAGHYDVILLSLSLSGGEGLDGFLRLDRSAPGVPIVVLADRAKETVALHAVRAGAADMLVKTQDTDETIQRAICNAVERAGERRNLRGREEHMRLLAEQLPCVYWTTDLRLRFTSFAGAGSARMEVDPGTMVGKDVARCFPEEETEASLVDAHRQAAEGRPTTLDLRWKERIYRVNIDPFRQRDGRLIGAVGVAVDVTDQKLIDLELRLTRQIQAGLLPSSAPALAGFDIAGTSRSVAEAGGDYYDYFRIRDGTTGIVVCDVGGHGLGPAMMMSHTRAYLRTLALSFDDPGRILTTVNRFLCEDIAEERLVTLFFAKLDARSRTLVYANAGHQGYLLPADGQARLLGPSGLPLNVLEDATTATAPPIVLATGDMVLLYTDGIVENPVRDGGQFGTERMIHVLRQTRRQTASHAIEKLFQSVRDQSPQGQAFDDMTAVVIKVV